MKVDDRRSEVGEHGWLIAASGKPGPRISQHAVHVAYQLVRGTDAGSGSKVSELLRRSAKRLLRPIGKSRQKMREERSLFIHRIGFLQRFKMGSRYPQYTSHAKTALSPGERREPKSPEI